VTRLDLKLRNETRSNGLHAGEEVSYPAAKGDILVGTVGNHPKRKNITCVI